MKMWNNRHEYSRLSILESKADFESNQLINIPRNKTINEPPVMFGLRVEGEYETDEHGVPQLPLKSSVSLRLFGSGFSNNMEISFTIHEGTPGSICEYPEPHETKVHHLSTHTILVKIKTPKATEEKRQMNYICLKNPSTGTWIHQGSDSWLGFETKTPLIPSWLSILFMCICILLSSLVSGLTLGLMSLQQTELKILSNAGTDAEKKYVKAILPVRKNGNYLLCTLVLTNTLVNNIFTLLFESVTSGFIALGASTCAIVLLGEILPQALCSRHGLLIGAKTVYITRIFMIITFPLSYPLSLILTWLLGVELGIVYTRERIVEIIKMAKEHGDDALGEDEVNIISGALDLKKKIVFDIMTKIDDVYAIDYDAVLDFATISEIVNKGYSRVPVYKEERNNVVSILFGRDLAFIDPDDATPVSVLCKFCDFPCFFVEDTTTLDVIFKQFIEGSKGHLAFVQNLTNKDEVESGAKSEPHYKTVGIVTLEDVIEELIQEEILDETEVDSLRYRKFGQMTEEIGATHQNVHVSTQLMMAAFQYLCTSVDAFKPDVISENILNKLLKLDVVRSLKVKSKKKGHDNSNVFLYTQGVEADYFILILEGHVEVTVGKEKMSFECGPFSYFGIQTLEIPNYELTSQSWVRFQEKQLKYIPDYTVQPITDITFICIKSSLYFSALHMSLLHRDSTIEEELREKFLQISVTKFNDSVTK